MKQELKYIHTLSIGGIDRPLQIKIITMHEFLSKWTNLLAKYKNQPNNTNYQLKLNSLINDVIYTSLFKSGFLFLKKPFRSKRHMMKSLLKDEYEDYSNFIAYEILNEKKSKKK